MYYTKSHANCYNNIFSRLEDYFLGQGRAVLENADKLTSLDDAEKRTSDLQEKRKTPVWEDSDDEGLK